MFRLLFERITQIEAGWTKPLRVSGYGISNDFRSQRWSGMNGLERGIELVARFVLAESGRFGQIRKRLSPMTI
jgi:hypothetical protein